MKKTLVALFLFISAAALSWGAEVIPVTVGQFSTGQWYFEGKKSALAGNASLQFVPAVKFPTGLSLLPEVDSEYRGTRSAEELAGGNTLFQDTWENGLGLKSVKEFSDDWVGRARVSGRMKWYRETTDEDWGQGLYDYRTESVGTELERRWDRDASIAAGYDFSLLQFPNYSSLESQQTADLAREFSGNRVLDSSIHLLSLRASSNLPLKMSGGVQLYLSPRLYDEQTVVVRSGLLSATKREDVTTGATLSLDRAFRLTRASALDVGLLYGYTALNSNQNHYDARVTTFIPNFYDYTQQSLGANLRLGFGRGANGPMVAELGGAFNHRLYSSRVIQDPDGNYLSDKLYLNETSVTTAFSYPLAKNFHARVSSTFGRSSSNNTYEAVYRYNYSDANYQFGFTYEY